MKYIKSLLAIATVALLGSSAWADFTLNPTEVTVAVGDSTTVEIASDSSSTYTIMIGSDSGTSTYEGDYFNVQAQSSTITKDKNTTLTIDGKAPVENEVLTIYCKSSSSWGSTYTHQLTITVTGGGGDSGTKITDVTTIDSLIGTSGKYITSSVNPSSGILKYTSSATSALKVPANCTVNADILVVGGGGSGGGGRWSNSTASYGKGGDGGQVVSAPGTRLATGTYSITIGNGGQAPNADTAGNKGGDSSFAGGSVSKTATGGAGGARRQSKAVAGSPGSGATGDYGKAGAAATAYSSKNPTAYTPSNGAVNTGSGGQGGGVTYANRTTSATKGGAGGSGVVVVTVTSITIPGLARTVTGTDGTWNSQNWTIIGTTTPTLAWISGAGVELTANEAATLDVGSSAITAGKVTIKGTTPNAVLTIKNAQNLTIGDLDTTELAGSVVFEFTSTSELKELAANSDWIRIIRAAQGNVTFRFSGSSASNGFSVDFGNDGVDEASLNMPPLTNHLVFASGTHKMTRGVGVRYESTSLFYFGTGATDDNPTLLVENGATLEVYNKNLTFAGKQNNDETGLANMGGVIRVNDGGTLNFTQPSSGNTFNYHQRLYLEPGSTTTFAFADNTFQMWGGADGGTDGSNAQIYVPAGSGEAVIECTSGNGLRLGHDSGFIHNGLAVFVGTGSKLKIASPILKTDSNSILKKFGAGEIEITGACAAELEMTAGILALRSDTSAVPFGDALTIADGVTLRFPEAWPAKDRYALCDGELTANSSEDKVTTYVGTEEKSAYITYPGDKSVFWSDSKIGDVTVDRTDEDESYAISQLNTDVAEEDAFVTLKLKAGTELSLDEASRFARLSVVCAGELTLTTPSGAAPDDAWLAKIDLSGVTFIRHAWYPSIGMPVIAVNFNGGEGREEASDAQSAALDVDMYGSAWFNAAADAATGSDEDVYVYDTVNQEPTTSSAKLSWTSANTWDRTSLPSPAPFMTGYLDDGNSGASVTLTDIPFMTYDVIVYSWGDGDACRPISVNGTNYTASGSSTVEGNADWGDRTVRVPRYGANALRINGLSGDLSIRGGTKSDSSRGPLSAFVVVKAITPVATPTAIENLVYDGTEQAGVAPSPCYTIEGGTATDAGNYTATVTLAEDCRWADGSTEPTKTVAWSIAKRPVTVKADDAGKTYGEDDPELTATVTGTVGDDTITYTVTRAEGEDADTYEITASGETDLENYTVAYETGTFTIEKATPTIKTLAASQITEGATLAASALTGSATRETADGTVEVKGAFTWDDPTTKPSAEDSETTPFAVTFTPEDTANINPVKLTATVKVLVPAPQAVDPMGSGAGYAITETGGEATTQWRAEIVSGADVAKAEPDSATGADFSFQIIGLKPGRAKVRVSKDGLSHAYYTVTIVPTFDVTIDATKSTEIVYTNALGNTLTGLAVAGDTAIASASWGETTEIEPDDSVSVTITGIQAGKTAALTLKSGDETIGFITATVEYFETELMATGLLTMRDYTVVYTNNEGITLSNLGWTPRPGDEGKATLEFSAEPLEPNGELTVTIHAGGIPANSTLFITNGAATVCSIFADVDYPATNAAVKMVANTVVTNLYHNDTGVKLTGIHLNAPIEPSGVIESTRFLADDVEKDGDVAYEIVAGTACGTTAKATFDVNTMEADANFGSVTVTLVPVATPSIDLFVTKSGSVAFTNLTSSVMDGLALTNSNPLVATGSLGGVTSIAVDEEIEIGVQALDLTGDATLTLTSCGQTVAKVAVKVGYDKKEDEKTVIAGRPVQFVYKNETGAALTNLTASSGVALSDVSIAADGSVSFVIPNTATTATTKTYELKNNGVTIATYTVTTTAAPNLIEKDGIKHPIGNVVGTDPNKDYTFSQKDPSDIADLAFEKTSTYQANVFAIGKNQGRVTLVAQYQRSGGSLKDCGTFDILVYEETVQTNEVVMGSASEITFTSGVAAEWVAWSENPTIAKVTVAEGSAETCKPVITGLTPNETATLHVENDYARYTIEVFVEEPALDPEREKVYVAADGWAKTVVLTNETASESWTAVVSQGADNATASAQKVDNGYAELTITGKAAGAARVKLRNAADAVQKIYEVVVSPLLTAEMEATKTATVTPTVDFDDVTSDDVAEAKITGSSISVTGKAVGTTTLLVREDDVIVSYIDVTVGYTVTELEAISMKTSETKSFTYENNEGIVLTGLTLESDDESVATGLVEVASIGIDASQAFTVFPAGTPGKATLTLKSNGNTVATVEVTVAYPETDKTDEVKTLYGGEKDVTIDYVNNTGFDLNNLKVESSTENVATGLVASAVAKDGTATITVFGETAGTVELTLKNGDETIARYTVFVVPRIPVTVNASETTNGVEYVNSFTNELAELTVAARPESAPYRAEAEWISKTVKSGQTGTLSVTGLMATNDVTFVLKSGEMTIGYLDVEVGYHLEEFEPVALKTSDDPYVFNFTNVQGIALLNFAATSTNAAVATVVPATGTVEKDGSIDLTVTPAEVPGETCVEIYDGEYLIGTHVFTVAYPIAKGTNTLMVGTSVTNVWTNDTDRDLDALSVSDGDATVTAAIVGDVTSVKKGETVEVEITAGNTAGPALVTLKNSGVAVAEYGVQVVPLLTATPKANGTVTVAYPNRTGAALSDLRDAGDEIATATWAQPKWVEEDGSVNLTVKGLRAEGTTRLTLKSGETQVVGYIDVTVDWPDAETKTVSYSLDGQTNTQTYKNVTGLTLGDLTIENTNGDAVQASIGDVTEIAPDGTLVITLSPGTGTGTSTVTVKSGEHAIMVLTVTTSCPSGYYNYRGNIIQASNATKLDDGSDDLVLKFENTGSSTITRTMTIPNGLIADYLVVGGGGSGGKSSSSSSYYASGNGGEVKHDEDVEFAKGSYTITVGNGGASVTSNGSSGKKGEASKLESGTLNVTATGAAAATDTSAKRGTPTNGTKNSITGDEVEYGKGAAAASSTSRGAAGTNPGDGGQGNRSGSSYPSGKGANGIVIVRFKAIPIDAPTAVEGLVYDGEEQTGVEEGVGYTLTGHKATDAGEHTATAKLAKGYAWRDATTADRTIPWFIGYRPVTVTAVDTNKLAYAEEPDYQVRKENFVDGDATELVWTVGRTNLSEEVGTYDIIVDGEKRQGSYEITYEKGTLTIERSIDPTAVDPRRIGGVPYRETLGSGTAESKWTVQIPPECAGIVAVSPMEGTGESFELEITGLQPGAAEVRVYRDGTISKVYKMTFHPTFDVELEATEKTTVTFTNVFDETYTVLGVDGDTDIASASWGETTEVAPGETAEITITGIQAGKTAALALTSDGETNGFINVTVDYTVTELGTVEMKTSETKSFTYVNNEGIVLTGLTLESDDESVATGLVEVASIGIDASQSFTVFPAGTPGKATLTLKSNGNTVATVEVTTAYPVTDETGTVVTLYGGEKDVTIAYENNTGFDLNNLKVESDNANVATGLVASVVAKDGTATIAVFGLAAGTVELTLKNGDETIARYTVFVVPRIPVTVNASETTNGVEYVNVFTNALSELTVAARPESAPYRAEAEWISKTVKSGQTGTLSVTGLMATNDVTFVLKSGEMTIGYLDVAVGYHLEEFEPVALKTSDDPYVFNFTNVQGIALLNFAATSTNAAVATVVPATGTVEKDGSIDLTVTPAGAPGETRVEIYDGEYLIGTRVFTTTYPVAKGTNTLAVGTSITNVWTNDTGFDLDALTVETSGVALAYKLSSKSVKNGEMVEIEITAENTAGPALVLLKNNGETVARYGVQVVPILKASVEASKEVELTYDNATGMDLDDLRDAADAIATATWAQPKWVEGDGSIKLTVKGLQADKETRLTLKSGETQVVGYIDVSVGYPTVETNKVALVLEDGSGTATFTYVNKTGLTLDGLTVKSDNEDAVLADLGGVTSVDPNGELVVNFTSSIDPGTATVTVKSGERVISVLVVTAGIKQEEKPTANLTLIQNTSVTYTTFGKSTNWTYASSANAVTITSATSQTFDEPSTGTVTIRGASAGTANVTIKDADGNLVKTIAVRVLATNYSATGLKVGANDQKTATHTSKSTSWQLKNQVGVGASDVVSVSLSTATDGKSATATTTGQKAGDASFTINRSSSNVATGGYVFYRVWEEKPESIALDVGRTVEMVCESVNPAKWKLGDPGAAADYIDVTLSNTSEYADRVKLTIKAKQQWADAISFTVKNDYAEWTVTLKATPVPDGAITGAAITYGETLASSTTFSGTMMAGSTKVDGTFAWVDKTVAPTVADSGVTEYDVIFTPDKLAKYFVTTNKATVTVNPKPITVTADDETIAFGETPDLTYKITTDSLVGADTLVGSLKVEGELTVGTHDIVQADDWENPNYAITYVKGTLTVEKAPVELTDVSSSSGVNEGMKDKADDSYYAVVTMANGRYTFDKDATVSRIEVTGATSFTVSDNYTLTTNELAKFTLNGIPGTLIGEYLLGGGTLTGGNFKIAVGDDDVAVRLTGGTYAFEDDATIAIPGTITLEGDVNLAVAAGKTLTYDAGTEFDCGDFKFILTGEGLVDFKDDTLKVQENNYSAKADGEQHSATASVTEFVSAAATDPARTATVEYTTDGETWTAEPPAFDAVGEYKVGYRVTVAGIEKKTGTLTVKILKWDDVSSEEKIAAGDPTAFTLTSPLSETWTVESSASAKVAVAPASATGKEFTFTMTGANAGDTAVVTVRSGTYTATYNVTVVAGEENENITIIPGTTVSFATVLRATGGAEWKMTAAYLQGDESNFEILSEPVNGSLNVSVTGVEAGGLVRLSLRRTTASAIEKTIVVKVAEKEADEDETLKVGDTYVTKTGSTGVKSDKWCYRFAKGADYVTVEENDKFDYTAEFTVTAIDYSGNDEAEIEIYYNAEDPADPAAILLKTVTVKTAVEGTLACPSSATTVVDTYMNQTKAFVVNLPFTNCELSDTGSTKLTDYLSYEKRTLNNGQQTLLLVTGIAARNSSQTSSSELVLTYKNKNNSDSGKIAFHAYGPNPDRPVVLNKAPEDVIVERLTWSSARYWRYRLTGDAVKVQILNNGKEVAYNSTEKTTSNSTYTEVDFRMTCEKLGQSDVKLYRTQNGATTADDSTYTVFMRYFRINVQKSEQASDEIQLVQGGDSKNVHTLYTPTVVAGSAWEVSSLDESVATVTCDSGAGQTSGTLTVTAKNAGTTKIFASNGVLEYTLDLTVKPFDVTITVIPDNVTKCYGDPDNLTYTIDGLPDGVNVLEGTHLLREAGEDVDGGKQYLINLGDLQLDDPNYSLTLDATPKYLTITQKCVTVVADAGQSKVYGEADPTLTYTTEPAQLGNGGDIVLEGALTRESGENVGEYDILQGTVDNNEGRNPNYTIVGFESAKFAITKAQYDMKDVKVANGGKVTYNGEGQTVTLEGLPDGVTVQSVVFTGLESMPTNAGVYEATVTFAVSDPDTYDVPEAQTFDLEIEKATITSATIKSVEFDGQEHAPEVTEVKAGELIVPEDSYEVEDVKFTHYGTHSVRIDAAAEGNFKGSVFADFYISKAVYDMSGVVFTNETYLYDGQPHKIVLGGTLPEGVVCTSVTETAYIDVGEYTYTAKFAGDEDHEPIADMTAVLTIRAGKVTVNGKAYDDVEAAMAELRANGGTAVFNEEVDYAAFTFEEDTTLTVADGAWFVTNNLTVAETTVTNDISVAEKLTLAGNVTVGSDDAEAMLAFGSIDVGDYKLTLTTNGVVQSATKLDETVFAEVEHFHVAEKATTGGYEYTLVATEFYVKYYDGDEVVHSNKFTILNYMTDLHIWNGQRDDLLLVGYTREDGTTPLAVTDEALRDYIKDEAEDQGCDGEVKVLGTWKEVPKTFDITIAKGEGIEDVQTNGVSVVGTLTLSADTTEVELTLEADVDLTVPVFKVVTNGVDGVVTSVTTKVATYAIKDGDTLEFFAEEAEWTDPDVTDDQIKTAIKEAIDPANPDDPDDVERYVKAVTKVETVAGDGAGQVPPKELATWITDNGVKSADLAESDYVVASVKFDTEKPITDENTEVEFTEVEAATSDEFVFTFELDIEGEPQDLTLVKEYVAGCIQTTGDLGTDFAVIGDPKRVTITDDGKVTITPDPTKSAEFFKIVIPKDPGVK